jgi:hypothetical protein
MNEFALVIIGIIVGLILVGILVALTIKWKREEKSKETNYRVSVDRWIAHRINYEK